MPSTQGGAAGFLKEITEFSVNIFNAIICEPDTQGKNFAISTFPLHTMLSLVSWGTRGQCFNELAKVLRLEEIDRKVIGSHFQYLTTKLKNTSDSALKIAIKILLRDPYDIDKEFEEIANEQFQAETEKLDFFYNDRAADFINRWIGSMTDHKVHDIVDAGNISIETELLAICATHFNSKWSEAVKKTKLKKEEFWITETINKHIETISFSGKFNHGLLEDLRAEAVEIPFEGSELSLVVLLPLHRCGINLLENNLKVDHIRKLPKIFKEKALDVRLPKFKVESRVSLQNVLEKIGMSCIFSEYADFGYLMEMPEAVRMTQVIHKNIIEIDEHTSSTLDEDENSSNANTSDQSQFFVDHPFVFILRWMKFNLPIMMGMYRTPQDIPIFNHH